MRLTVTTQDDRLCILPRDEASYRTFKRALARAFPNPEAHVVEDYRDAVDAGVVDARVLFDAELTQQVAAALNGLDEDESAEYLRSAAARLGGGKLPPRVGELLDEAERLAHSRDEGAMRRAVVQLVGAVRLMARSR